MGCNGNNQERTYTDESDMFIIVIVKITTKIYEYDMNIYLNVSCMSFIPKFID